MPEAERALSLLEARKGAFFKSKKAKGLLQQWAREGPHITGTPGKSNCPMNGLLNFSDIPVNCSHKNNYEQYMTVLESKILHLIYC